MQNEHTQLEKDARDTRFVPRKTNTWNELRNQNREETSEQLGIDIINPDNVDNTMAELGLNQVETR